MNTKTALVTGGTDGVGKSIVKALVAKHYNVFFIGANQDKGLKLEAELKKTLAGDTDTNVSFIHLDLSDIKSVKQFAGVFSETHARLDLLLLSAGVAIPKRLETDDGIEKTFAIGYLSAFVLCHELAPLLAKGDKSRILLVSGGGEVVLKERLDFNDFNNVKNYNAIKSAARTVHAKTVLTEVLSKEFADKDIDVNCFHPGIVKSGLGRNMPWPISFAFKGASLVMPRESKTGIYACISESLNGVTGQFLVSKKRIPLKFNEAYKEKLIKNTESILSAVFDS